MVTTDPDAITPRMLAPATGRSIGRSATRARSSRAVVFGSCELTGVRPYLAEVLRRWSAVGFDWGMSDSDPQSWMIDAGGITIAAWAADDRYAATVRERLGAVPCDADEPEITLRVGPGVPPLPDGEEAQPLEGYLGWEDGSVIWIADRDMAVRIDGSDVVVGGTMNTRREEDRLDDLLQFGVATAGATPNRVMLHAAAIARGDDALLLVGGSGRGKSTLAGSALVGGWTLLGDDLAVIDASTLSVRAVRRAALIPHEVTEPHGLEGVQEDGKRGRVGLPLETLGVGSRRLVGVISVEHGTDGAATRRDAHDLDVLHTALAVPPFRGVIRRHLAVGAALLSLPAVTLEHAQDPSLRVPRAIELLDDAWELVTAGAAQ